MSVPDRMYPLSISNFARLSVAANFDTHRPTPVLQSNDRGQHWTLDPGLLSQFPDAYATKIAAAAGVWVASGTSGTPNHVDAWASADGHRWSQLPSKLRGGPGGILNLIGEVGGTIVLFGTAPELDRYYTFEPATSSAGRSAAVPSQSAVASTACPNSVRRRLVEGVGANESADGLPSIDNASTDVARVQQALAAHESELRMSYPDVVGLDVGPGYGRAWTGQNGGQYRIVDVHDYAIVVHLRTTSACPQGADLYVGVDNVPLFFVVDA